MVILIWFPFSELFQHNIGQENEDKSQVLQLLKKIHTFQTKYMFLSKYNGIYTTRTNFKITTDETTKELSQKKLFITIRLCILLCHDLKNMKSDISCCRKNIGEPNKSIKKEER